MHVRLDFWFDMSWYFSCQTNRFHYWNFHAYVQANTASTQYASRRAHHGCLQPSVAQGEGGGCNGGDRYGEVAALHRPRHQVSRRDCELGQNEVYEGLDIITNKITEEEQPGAPPHHLGIAHPNVDFTASDFRDMASLSIESILGGRRLPIIVGGFNSYIDARYECCFLWVDVSRPVLHSFVSKRVDQMVGNGMVEEFEQLFYPNAD